jgi:hypothetical protein
MLKLEDFDLAQDLQKHRIFHMTIFYSQPHLLVDSDVENLLLLYIQTPKESYSNFQG